jgi:hypothetical protein
MPRATPFRLNRTGLLLALISTAFAGEAGAAAGRVEFAVGPATVVGVDGSTRPAARGTELDTGDVVRTNDGRVQMRMTDGAFISLQPNTEFGIKDYKYQGKTDGSENAFYSLVKGAMRTVTGLIGRVNRNKYQVATPTATVGIRGTGGLIQVLNDGSTLVQGTSGIWFLANPAGTIDIPAGVAGLAPVDPKQPPRETVQIPTAGPSPLPALLEYAQGEQRETDGTSVITAPAVTLLQTGTGYMGAVAYSRLGSPQLTLTPGATATFDSAGRMTSIVDTNGQIFKSDGSSITEVGNDGTIAWGRWTGNVTGLANIDGLLPVNENYNANQGLHYVVGSPTASMPKIGTATYAFLGATSPTYVDGRASPGTLTGSLNVDFGKMNVGINLDVGIGVTAYTIGGSAPISGSTFSANTAGSLTLSGTNGCSTCSASVDGFFAGATAERAGLGYQINDASTNIVGAAAFTKTTQ